MQKTVFLDRDGVINDNTTHVNTADDFKIYEEAKSGMKKLHDAGYDIYVVTNQGGVELGHITTDQLDEIHNKMVEDLKDYCKIKEIKYCPDFKKPSECRKPKPGMIVELAEKYNIELENSWMVGDMDTDIEAGKRAGCKTAKIGKPNRLAEINGEHLDEIADEILKTDKFISQQESK